MEWTESLYDPIYVSHGVPAAFTPAGEDGTIDFTILDQTSGVTIHDDRTLVETTRPAARVRATEVAENGLIRADLSGGTIEFNGNIYTVTASRPLPSPGGEADGEYLLLLSAA